MQNHGFTGESILGLEPGDSRWGSYAINTTGMDGTLADGFTPLGLCGIFDFEFPVKESQVIAPSEMYAISDTRQFPILPGNGGGDDVSGVRAGSSVGNSWLYPWTDEPLGMFGADGVTHEFPPPHAQCYNVVHVEVMLRKSQRGICIIPRWRRHTGIMIASPIVKLGKPRGSGS